MKSNAPWSVKGIERDARETAKEAARREGMTVGEWLNHMIYSAGDPQTTDGEIDGLKLRDVVTAVEHLHKRVADSNREGNAAVDEMTRKIGEVLERVQRLERVKPEPGGDVDIAQRLERLEEKTNDKTRIDALKALEKAVSHVAIQFSESQKSAEERLRDAESNLQVLADRVENAPSGQENTGVEFLRDAIDGLSTRIARTEKLLSEAAQLRETAAGSVDPEFVESTGNRLRVLGEEIKRGGDQIKTLENTIVKLAKQIDAAEKRSAEGVEKTAETLSALKEDLAREPIGVQKELIAEIVAAANKKTEDRVDNLQATFGRVLDQLNAAAPNAGAVAPAIPAERTNELADTPTGETEAETDSFLEDAFDDLTTQLDGDAATGDASSKAADAVLEVAPDSSTVDEPATTADDDDFFSFADDIEAKIDEGPTSEADDDFSFDFDSDETKDQGADEIKALNTESTTPVDDPIGAELLSAVQSSLTGSQTPQDADASTTDEFTDGLDDEPAGDENTADSAPSELDALLKDLNLDDDDDDDHPPSTSDEETTDETSTSTIEAHDETVGETPDQEEDYLAVIRRKAREAAADREEQDGAKPSRRKLSPKQRKALAARVRQKRLEKEQNHHDDVPVPAQSATAETEQAVDQAAHDSFAAEPVADERSPSSKKSIFAKLPFIGGFIGEVEHRDDHDDKKIAQDPQPEQSAKIDDEKNDELNDIGKSSSSRLITLALCLGIGLALVLIFFLLRGQFTGNTPSAQSTPPAPVVSGTAATPSTTPVQTIDPSTLYRDAVTGLTFAQTQSEMDAAVKKLQEAALLGHPPAQLQLGELYKTGQGVTTDLEQARTWYRRSANGGNVLAMHRIGVMTAEGQGGIQDMPAAIDWFERAAQFGLVDAQFNLGALHYPTGNGEEGPLQDAAKAYFWYSIAALNGDTQSEPLATAVTAWLSEAERAQIDSDVSVWVAQTPDAEANAIITNVGG